MACGSSHILWKNNEIVKELSWKEKVKEMEAEISTSLECEQETTVKLDKFICYSTALDMEKTELETFVNKELEIAEMDSELYLEKCQKEYMESFWKIADVEIKGNEAVQQGIHFNLYHIIQAAGRDGRTGMGAKGLSG